jgi:hypothetical protein
MVFLILYLLNCHYTLPPMACLSNLPGSIRGLVGKRRWGCEKASKKNWGKKQQKSIFLSAVFVALGEGTSSPSTLSLALGEGPLPPSATNSALKEPFFIFFVFLPHFVCEAFPHYLILLAQIWLTFEFFCCISLFFSFVEFLGTLQIWTTGTWNHIIWRFKKWYSWYLVYIETISSNSHEMSSILLSWHDEQLTGKVVLNYRKSGRSPKNTKLVGTSCYHM